MGPGLGRGGRRGVARTRVADEGRLSSACACAVAIAVGAEDTARGAAHCTSGTARRATSKAQDTILCKYLSVIHTNEGYLTLTT